MAKICWQSILLAINFIDPHNVAIPVYTRFFLYTLGLKASKGVYVREFETALELCHVHC